MGKKHNSFLLQTKNECSCYSFTGLEWPGCYVKWDCVKLPRLTSKTLFSLKQNLKPQAETNEFQRNESSWTSSFLSAHCPIWVEKTRLNETAKLQLETNRVVSLSPGSALLPRQSTLTNWLYSPAVSRGEKCCVINWQHTYCPTSAVCVWMTSAGANCVCVYRWSVLWRPGIRHRALSCARCWVSATRLCAGWTGDDVKLYWWWKKKDRTLP